jgi:hypothetical protein
LLQGEVGLVGEELPEFVVAVRGDSRGAAAVVGAWLQGTRLVPEAEVVSDTVDGDVEAGCDGGQGTHAPIHSRNDTTAQFDRVSLHDKSDEVDGSGWGDYSDYSDCIGFRKAL